MDNSLNLEYEILCVDTDDNVTVRSAEAVCYSLLSNSRLLENATSYKQTQIKAQGMGLHITVTQVEGDDVDQSLSNTFLIRVNGKYSNLEGFRLPLLKHMKSQHFKNIYVLKDDASSEIATEIYPLINKCENSLRRYLMKFLVTKIGPRWWKLSTDNDMQHKASQRKNNEETFSKLAEGSPYLIDFGELGSIVYKQSSGFHDKSAIIKRIQNMPLTVEAIEELKVELQSNYTKFFKETFKDRLFQDNWTELEKIRHKVAHNNLFSESDRTSAISLSKILIETIEDAEHKIEAMKFSEQELDVMRDSISETSTNMASIDTNSVDITKDELLKRVQRSLRWSKEKGRAFLGRRQFIENYLGNGGYNIETSYQIIDELQSDGFLEFYEHPSLDETRTITAIRATDKNAPMANNVTQINTFTPNTPLAKLGDIINSSKVTKETRTTKQPKASKGGK